MKPAPEPTSGIGTGAERVRGYEDVMSGKRALLLEGAIHHLYHVGCGSTAVTVDVACIKALAEGFYFFFEGFHFISEFLHLAFYHVAILIKVFDDVAKITPSVGKGIFILRTHGHVNATIGFLDIVKHASTTSGRR